MKNPFRHFNRQHLRIFLTLYALCAGFMFFLIGLPLMYLYGDYYWGAVSVIGCVSGPLTGAIVRNFQSCCLQFSLELLPWYAAFLGVAVLFQFIPLPCRTDNGGNWLRLTVWTIGLLGWFLGIPHSFLHALE